MYAPTTDITEDEKNTLSEYLKNGGKMMLISGAEDQETPNLDAFMEEYGLQMADGYIADTERAYQGIHIHSSRKSMLLENLGKECQAIWCCF